MGTRKNYIKVKQNSIYRKYLFALIFFHMIKEEQNTVKI